MTANTEQTNRLLGTGDLATRFGWSPSGIKKLDRLGLLPAARRLTGRRYWDEDQLPLIERAIEARRASRRQSKSGLAA